MEGPARPLAPELGHGICLRKGTDRQTDTLSPRPAAPGTLRESQEEEEEEVGGARAHGRQKLGSRADFQ